MQCHASFRQSPKSLQVLYEQGKYKDPQGFGWELNKIIGTKIIYIPAQQVYQIATRNFTLSLGVFTAIFAVAIFLANTWLKKYVVQPLNQITKVAEAVSLGDIDADFQKKSNDEIGRLADAFRRLKISFVIAMKHLDQKEN